MRRKDSVSPEGLPVRFVRKPATSNKSYEGRVVRHVAVGDAPSLAVTNVVLGEQVVQADVANDNPVRIGERYASLGFWRDNRRPVLQGSRVLAN